MSESISKDAGPYVMLAGKNDRPMTSFSLIIRINKDGNIQNVRYNGKTYSIDAWNKQFSQQSTTTK